MISCYLYCIYNLVTATANVAQLNEPTDKTNIIIFVTWPGTQSG